MLHDGGGGERVQVSVFLSSFFVFRLVLFSSEPLLFQGIESYEALPDLIP